MATHLRARKSIDMTEYSSYQNGIVQPLLTGKLLPDLQ